MLSINCLCQVNIAIDDIKRILFLEDDDKVKASANDAKAEGTVESGNITAKTGPTHSQPSSQASMAIDDTIEQIDETEASSAKATEDRDVDD